ncbi:hypothetical protein DCS_04112 [Drechmeria coniospora]|uniref:Fungal lipase-type domain-containing protein n=1 Tax=Drechmeria coniospora TaxID=98403 RepID=A0A151GJ15_DRECN|nr:hypothetical protein DCS_04112 [Drechmeria coniospora]KYK57105.1 hypothetical protein DCS_04112 [Drechmeria coniospora]
MLTFQRTACAFLAASSLTLAVPKKPGWIDGSRHGSPQPTPPRNPITIRPGTSQEFMYELLGLLSAFSKDAATGHTLAKFVDNVGNDLQWTVDIDCWQGFKEEKWWHQGPDYPPVDSDRPLPTKPCKLAQACPNKAIPDLASITRSFRRTGEAGRHGGLHYTYGPLCETDETIDELQGRLAGASLIPIPFRGKTVPGPHENALAAPESSSSKESTNLEIMNQVRRIVSTHVHGKIYTGHRLAALVDSQGNDLQWTLDVECANFDDPNMEGPGALMFYDPNIPTINACKLFQICPNDAMPDLASTTRICRQVKTMKGYCDLQCNHEYLCERGISLKQLSGRLQGASMMPLAFEGNSTISDQTKLCSKPEHTERGVVVTPSQLADFKFYSQGGDHDINGYVAIDRSKKEIVLSVRGSWSASNWWGDLKIGWEICPYAKFCTLHEGFWESWTEIRFGVTEVIVNLLYLPEYTGYRVVGSGHSLGAAVVTIASVEFQFRENITMDVYSYGSPRIGNEVFANFASSLPGKIYRITQGADMVPRIPKRKIGYMHTSPEYWIKNGTKVDPGLEDFYKCTGIANDDCNGHTSGVNIGMHQTYFGNIDGCKSILPLKREEGGSEIEAELMSLIGQDHQEALEAPKNQQVVETKMEPESGVGRQG